MTTPPAKHQTLWFVLDVTVPPGAEEAVDLSLKRWLQDLRHRVLSSGVEIHEGTGRLLDLTTGELRTALDGVSAAMKPPSE